MKYYAIKGRGDKPTAVVFHDYLTSYYMIRSKSESFRKAFEASVRSVGSLQFKQSGESLKAHAIDPESIYWIKEVLKKACGNYWEVAKSGEVPGASNTDKIAESYLS